MSNSNSTPESSGVDKTLGEALGKIIIFMFVMGCVLIVLAGLGIALSALIIGLTAHFFGAIAAGLVGAALAGFGAWTVVSGAFGNACKWVTQKLTGVGEDL